MGLKAETLRISGSHTLRTFCGSSFPPKPHEEDINCQNLGSEPPGYREVRAAGSRVLSLLTPQLG